MNKPLSPTQCVYTILNRQGLEDAIASGGEGEFTEGKPWASAHRYLQGLDIAEPYPLLLGDAATTKGVEWVAMIEDIELLDGGKTKVTFSSLSALEALIPLGALRKASDDLPLSENYIRPYVPCLISGDVQELVLALLAEQGGDAEATPFEQISARTAADFVEAFKAIEPRMTTAQRAMLIGHARAPGHALSTLRLARLAGYDTFQAGNLHYGKLGRLVADHFGVAGLGNQTQALAKLYRNGRDEAGHWVWEMREQVLEALRTLRWVQTTDLDLLADSAAKDVDADPKCTDVSATVRQALIEARIGQGGYRTRLMTLWGGRCAITGCDLPEVVMASHSKAWADSSNEERLDEYNGLLLAAHVDRLFDAGLISFSDDGSMLQSARLSDAQLGALGISPTAKLQGLSPRHAPYLSAHRLKSGFGG